MSSSPTTRSRTWPAGWLPIRHSEAGSSRAARRTAAAATAAPISLTRVTLSNNSVVSPTANNYDGGGALFEWNGDPVTIVNSTITDNTAPVGGAIVENAGGTITVQGSTLSNNQGSGSSARYSEIRTGGAIAGDGGGTVVLTNGSLTGNTASLGGGAIVDDGGDTYTITGTTLSGNQAGTSGSADPGGAIDANGGGLWTITNSTIAGNTAFGPGQAIADFGYSNFGSPMTPQLNDRRWHRRGSRRAALQHGLQHGAGPQHDLAQRHARQRRRRHGLQRCADLIDRPQPGQRLDLRLRVDGRHRQRVDRTWSVGQQRRSDPDRGAAQRQPGHRRRAGGGLLPVDRSAWCGAS
jgi:hypothetical protein